MPNGTTEDQEKIYEYLNIIQERILAPIQNTDLQRSCTATLLLLFAAIDGVGKLSNHDRNAGSNKRILGFLDYMGGDYAAHKRDLLNLRHSLVHNAINVESFLSHSEMGADQHLKKLGAAGFVYVNTMVMYRDFVDTFNRFRAEIQHNFGMMKRAAGRLEWKDDNQFNDQNILTPSPPPRVQFIYAK